MELSIYFIIFIGIQKTYYYNKFKTNDRANLS